jgi:signal transduction histidine kinase/cell division protein FtsB
MLQDHENRAGITKNLVIQLTNILAIMFTLSFLWEFWFEDLILVSLFGDEPEGEDDRWEFIFTSLSFAFLALIYPFWRIKKSFVELNKKDQIIKELNRDLGLKFNERTKSLTETNESLKEEIQKRHKSEQLVIQQRQNFYNMLDFLPMAFHLQASDYTVPFANKVFRERFGDPQKKRCHELMHNRSQPCEVCTTFKVFDHGKDEVTVWDAADGRTYITVCAPFADVDDSPLVMEMALDITEQESAKKDAIVAKEIAEKASQAKSEFLSRMSHELRTPMNAVLGFGQLLEMDQENPLKPQQKTNVQHILQAGQHLLGLINEVLDLSKIESGNLSLSIERVSPHSLFAEALNLLQPLLDEKNLKFELPSETQDTFVLADRGRLKQVALNLMSNAIKYNRQEGSISVLCDKLDDHKIRISVHDTGIGISQKNLEEIFKPFQRIESETETIEGTGVGLTISRKLVQLMKGSLEAQSEEGKGSCFSITLPECTDLSSLQESK